MVTLFLREVKCIESIQCVYGTFILETDNLQVRREEASGSGTLY